MDKSEKSLITRSALCVFCRYLAQNTSSLHKYGSFDFRHSLSPEPGMSCECDDLEISSDDAGIELVTKSLISDETSGRLMVLGTLTTTLILIVIAAEWIL